MSLQNSFDCIFDFVVIKTIVKLLADTDYIIITADRWNPWDWLQTTLRSLCVNCSESLSQLFHVVLLHIKALSYVCIRPVTALFTDLCHLAGPWHAFVSVVQFAFI